MRKMINNILDIMLNEVNYDFSGCSYSMLERRIKMRFAATGSSDMESYYHYLLKHKEESELLMQAVTIKVSHFFRNPLEFEIINKILGYIIIKKLEKREQLRIWSAGCATGEEAYSLAILVREHTLKEELDIAIFASDIDREALSKAREGVYGSEVIKEIKYGLLEKYFERRRDKFIIRPEIKRMVNFTFHDQLNSNNIVPKESIFGNFDLVLCRNLMIYYNLTYQEKIERRLYDSLRTGGYLMLGEAERIAEQYQSKLRQVSPFSKIYKKIG